MEKLGVIGGMGPEATAYFYEELIRHTQAATDQEHLDVVVLSCASMPDRTKAIISGDDEQLLSTMARCTHDLEQLGCSHIAIPCNTSHYFYDQIQATTSIPIIHMPQEAVKEAVQSCKARCIGIMGTDGTVQSGVYAKQCHEAGIDCIIPSTERQADVMSLIYDDIKAGRPADMEKFNRVVDELISRRCDTIILACTELSVLKRDYSIPALCIDAMDVLVRESIVRSGARYI